MLPVGGEACERSLWLKRTRHSLHGRLRSAAGRVRRWSHASFRALRLRHRRGFARACGGRIVRMDAVCAATSPPPHETPVDVIVCVHNALPDVRRCLASVIRYTSAPYSLILVDDGSDTPTQEYLAEFSQSQGAVLIRNEQAGGYTKAANQGLRTGSAEFQILLNSDTEVVPEWLDRLVACAESDARIGIVSVLSNTASWQSVPDLLDERGDWAENRLPDGTDVTDMGRLVARYSGRLYPRLPFLNGFCLMIRRDTVRQVGYFDESAFEEGYGEENDYCLRVRRAGWELCVADDVYIHHFHSRSYTHERRNILAERANDRLVAMYGAQPLCDGANQCRFDRVMQGIRCRSREMSKRERLVQEGRRQWEGSRVAFVLPSTTACSDSIQVVHEAEAMQKMGVDARIAGPQAHLEVLEKELPENSVPLISLDRFPLPGDFLAQCDATVVTASSTADWLAESRVLPRAPITAYYIQENEPTFLSDRSDLFQSAMDSRTRTPGVVWITKTHWHRKRIRENFGIDCEVVGPSVDIDLFRARAGRETNSGDASLRVAARVCSNRPDQLPDATVESLSKFCRSNPGNVEVTLFGCRDNDSRLQQPPTNFPWRHAGLLTQPELASLLSDVDIFVDFSHSRAISLVAWEAMACGTAVIISHEAATDGLAEHGRNVLAADTRSPESSLAVFQRLVDDADLRNRVQQQAVNDACRHSPETAAHKILTVLFPSGHHWNHK